MIDLECTGCGYKFSRQKIPQRCPYCSSEKSVSLLKTAQDLLDETAGESRAMDEERNRRSF